MKVNIANLQSLDSYENFNIYAKALFQAQVEQKISDEQCTEFICQGILEQYEFKDYENIVAFISKKCRKGAKVVLSTVNGRRLAEEIYYGEMPNSQGNLLVFGEKSINKSIVFDEFEFVELLNKHQVQVVQIRREGAKDIYVCQKQ